MRPRAHVPGGVVLGALVAGNRCAARAFKMAWAAIPMLRLMRSARGFGVDSTRRRPGERPASTHWLCGLWEKALVVGTKDCRFESCQGHFGLRFAPRAATARERGSFWKLTCVISHCLRRTPLAANSQNVCSQRLQAELPCTSCAPLAQWLERWSYEP